MSKLRGFEVVSAYADKSIKLPSRKTRSSAGYDLEIAETVTLAPRGTALLPTGVKAYMQPSEVLYIHIRSSMAVKLGLMLTNSVGVIDADYYGNADNEGHIFVPVRNHQDEPITITKGERIAQGIFANYLLVDGDTAGEGAERSGGFGSTGKA